MSNFNLTYQKDGENEQLYYKDAYNNDLYIRSCEDFAPAIIQEKSGNPIDITDGADCPIRKLKVIFEPIQSGTGVPSPENVRPINGRQSVTVTRTGKNLPPQSVTIPLGQTVYGGTVDVTGGEAESKYYMIDLGTLSWMAVESATAGYNRFGALIASPNPSAKAFPTGVVATAVCSAYPTKSGDDVYSRIDGISITSTGHIMVYDSRYAQDTAASFKAAMSGVMLCYELAAPLEITVDPATLSTLKGENTFSTDGTSIELEYVVDTKTYIDNLFNSGTKTVVKPNDEIKIIDENKGVE